MEISADVVLGWIGGAVMGAMVAYLGNRVMNTELWGHLKKHCRELSTAEKRLDAHSDLLRKMGERVAVLFDRSDREDCG